MQGSPPPTNLNLNPNPNPQLHTVAAALPPAGIASTMELHGAPLLNRISCARGMLLDPKPAGLEQCPRSYRCHFFYYGVVATLKEGHADCVAQGARAA
jgi:hypothetical protein